ncbi:MAG TPA: protein-L-isoaspartate O-methyltransferase [Pelomicrobium sp.]|nr:protein-L-isoaspartate O-methyltransferase [Pelomicrobium sp.]
MNVEQARYNMVEQQIRPWEVLDQGVLDLLFEVRREEFVPPTCRELAFADMEIPLGRGEVMLQPKIEARMLQELSVKPGDKVLEVGTGSGYMTALLARRGAHVYSVEIDPELKAFGEANLKAHGIANVTLELGDAARGWSRHAPYDVIVLTGSVPVLPEAFPHSLGVGGRLMAIVGEPPVMRARLVVCTAEGVYGEVDVFDTVVPPLRNAPTPPRFRF